MTNLETINVIIAGHIDHGKTTLLQKITGKWTDSHSEELKRGITIKLGYADTTIYEDSGKYNTEKKGKPVRNVSFIDAPGHEMLMATMLSGAAIVDAAILVVAANEGIKPQTKEHLLALQTKGIDQIIIVQNKIDLISKEQALKNYEEIKKLLEKYKIKADVIPISAKQNVNLDKLYEHIAKLKIPQKDQNSQPIFLVARSFDINKPGTKPSDLKGAVLGGTLKQGTLKVGDEIEIKPGMTAKEANQIKYIALKTKIRNLFRGTEKIDKIVPGGSLAIETELDMSLAKTDALSGCIISLPNSLPEITTNLRMSYNLFENFEEKNEKIQLKTGEMVMLSINTSVTVGDIKKISDKEIELSLRIPIVPFQKDTIGIAKNINNHWRLIGSGKIL